MDRDGIIVKNINGIAPMKPSEMELISESIPLIKKFQKSGYKIFIVSNQPDAALGIINETTKKALVKKFKDLLKNNDLTLDGIYYCFHHPKGVVKKYTKDCDCKKPKPGLLLKAIHNHRINPKGSFIIGDRASDIKAGGLAGVKTILLDPENSENFYLQEYGVKPDFVIKTLSEALNIIKS